MAAPYVAPGGALLDPVGIGRKRCARRLDLRRAGAVGNAEQHQPRIGRRLRVQRRDVGLAQRQHRLVARRLRQDGADDADTVIAVRQQQQRLRPEHRRKRRQRVPIGLARRRVQRHTGDPRRLHQQHDPECRLRQARRPRCPAGGGTGEQPGSEGRGEGQVAELDRRRAESRAEQQQPGRGRDEAAEPQPTRRPDRPPAQRDRRGPGQEQPDQQRRDHRPSRAIQVQRQPAEQVGRVELAKQPECRERREGLELAGPCVVLRQEKVQVAALHQQEGQRGSGQQSQPRRPGQRRDQQPADDRSRREGRQVVGEGSRPRRQPAERRQAGARDAPCPTPS
jgi:hypothetical protein